MKDWEDYKGKHCSKWIQLCEKIRSEADPEELAKAEQFAADLIERWKAGEDVVLVQESVKGVLHCSHTEVDSETGVVTVYFIQREPARRVVITGTLEP